MTTNPSHITSQYGPFGIRSTCHLCHAYNVAADSLNRHDDATNWATAHADMCTPDTVRTRAAGMRDAIDHIRDLAHDGDPALWDEGDGQRAHDAIVNRLRVRALELETNVDMATTAASSGSVEPRAHNDGAR